MDAAAKLLKVVPEACLMENPKSYSAWHHRKWVVGQGLAPLERELQLVTRALDEDSRNFHAWNYRQFVCRKLGRSAQDELGYVEEKIIQNFSNYSAWHFRTMLLHQIYGTPGGPEAGVGTEAPASASSPAPGAGGTAGAAASGSASQRSPIPHEVLDAEYDMVHQAFATDARDESPWTYYRWLVGNTLAHLGPAAATAAAAAAAGSLEAASGAGADAAASGAPGTGGEASREGREGQEGQAEVDEEARARVAAVLEREAARLQEDHLAAEPDAKRPLLALARLREAQARLGLGDSAEAGAALLEEARGIYRRLMDIDPLRRGYYQDALEGRAFVVVQALGTV
eukprot:XP_001692385.1 predicted protein [Chlamydomonas reinhardtii]